MKVVITTSFGVEEVPLHEVENVRSLFLWQRCRARMGSLSVKSGEEKGLFSLYSAGT